MKKEPPLAVAAFEAWIRIRYPAQVYAMLRPGTSVNRYESAMTSYMFEAFCEGRGVSRERCASMLRVVGRTKR